MLNNLFDIFLLIQLFDFAVLKVSASAQNIDETQVWRFKRLSIFVHIRSVSISANIGSHIIMSKYVS